MINAWTHVSRVQSEQETYDMDTQLLLDQALSELNRLRAENDALRGLLGNSAKDCAYCGLPATDQAKCERGFPGCSRADDQMLSAHFAAGYDAEQLRKENEALRADAERWQFVAAQMTHEQSGPHVGWTLGALYEGDDPESAIDAARAALKGGE